MLLYITYIINYGGSGGYHLLLVACRLLSAVGFCRRLKFSAGIVIVSSALGYDIGCCCQLELSAVDSWYRPLSSVEVLGCRLSSVEVLGCRLSAVGCRLSAVHWKYMEVNGLDERWNWKLWKKWKISLLEVDAKRSDATRSSYYEIHHFLWIDQSAFTYVLHI